MRANVPGDRIRFCFPPMHGIGAMHSKLMLLKYEGYMRIVVPTGNFMSYDWGETGTMENVSCSIITDKLCLKNGVLTGCRRCSSSTFQSLRLRNRGKRRSPTYFWHICLISSEPRDSTRISFLV
jgi:hypothetical protein